MGMDEMDGGTQGTMEELGWIEPQNISNGAGLAAEPELRKQEAVVEAVLFTMGQSVEIGQLAAALQGGNVQSLAAGKARGGLGRITLVVKRYLDRWAPELLLQGLGLIGHVGDERDQTAR